MVNVFVIVIVGMCEGVVSWMLCFLVPVLISWTVCWEFGSLFYMRVGGLFQWLV